MQICSLMYVQIYVQERPADGFRAQCRPEQRIAVVTHCAFLRHTLRPYASEFGTFGQDELLRDFNNCELRSMVLSDFEGSTMHDSTWFQGGKDYKMGSQRASQ